MSSSPRPRSLGVVDPGHPRRAEEEYANEFAMNLLMPGFAVRHFYAKGATLGQLASIFGVERSTMQRRLDDLGLPI